MHSHFQQRQKILVVAIAGIVGTLGFSHVSPVFAQAATSQAKQLFDIRIPAQSMSGALAALSKQTGTQIISAGDSVANINAPAVSGQLTAQQALNAVLAGSHLMASVSASGAFIVQQKAGGPDAVLPEVKVKASQETATSSVFGYVARRSATGTKSDIALLETPQAVTVVTRDQMDAQAAESLDQAFNYSSSIFAQDGGADRRTSTSFTMRGFNVTGSQPLYLNGTRFPINSYNAQPEMYSYERVELLKGPASILYGNATPGGIINMVSKLPTSEPLKEIEVQVGSWDRRQVAVDFSGPLTQDGRLRYRLGGLVRDSKTMVSEIPDDRRLLNAALDWQLSQATSLTLLATYNKGRSVTGSFAVPKSGTLTPNVFGKVPRTLFTGEPGFDGIKTEGKTLGYLLEHRLNDGWKLRQNFLVYDYDVNNAYSNIGTRTSVLTPVPVDSLARTLGIRFDHDKGMTLDNQLHGKLQHGSVVHSVIVGLDWNKRDWTRQQRSGTQRPLDLLKPVYGVSGISLGLPSYTAREGKQIGLYAQDHIKFDEHWIALLGARYDEAEDRERITATNGRVTNAKVKSDALSPRAALMYLVDGGIAPYYSFTKSYQPTQGSDFNGRSYEPTHGKQHEAGIKYEPPGVNASVTVAAYEITQSNVLTADPVNANFSVQTGEVRSRGVELEGRASLGRQLDLVGALSTTDARITKSNRGDVGNRLSSVPRQMASLWGNYRFQAVSGLSAGVGVRRIGRRADLTGVEVLQPFTIYDAALRYEFDKWQLALNIKNLADKDYVSACTFYCFNGDERSMVLTARYRW